MQKIIRKSQEHNRRLSDETQKMTRNGISEENGGNDDDVNNKQTLKGLQK